MCSKFSKMSFLLPIDYHSIIEFAIDLKEKDISHYFFNQHQQHKSTNTNFVDNLKETISDLEERFEELIKRNIVMWEGADEVKKIKKKIDYRKSIDWKNESFYYSDGKLNHDFPIAWSGKEYKRFTISKLEEIKSTFETFITNIESFEQNKIPPNNIPKTPKISLFQKIHLLHNYGFFELDVFKDMSDLKKGKLISLILNQSEKNTFDTIRERFNTKQKNNEIEKLKEILNEWMK